MIRRRLLLTTALVPIGVLPAPHPAAAYGLAPARDASGRVVAWINPQVLAALRASSAAIAEKKCARHPEGQRALVLGGTPS